MGLIKQGSCGHVEAAENQLGSVTVKGLLCPFWVEREEHAGKDGHLSMHLHLQESIHGIRIPMEFHVALELGRFTTIPNTTFPDIGGFLVGFDPASLKSLSNSQEKLEGTQPAGAPKRKVWWRRWIDTFRSAPPEFKREGRTLRWGQGTHHLMIEDDVPAWALDWLFDGHFVRLSLQPKPVDIASAMDKHFRELQVLAARHRAALDKEAFVGLARVKFELSYAIHNSVEYNRARDTLHELCKQASSQAARS
jgi:hypothetical protein